jgi:hypothetical protein
LVEWSMMKTRISAAVLAVLVVSHPEAGADMPLHGVSRPGTGADAEIPPYSIEGLTLWTKGTHEERRPVDEKLVKELRRHFRNPNGKTSFPIVFTVTNGRGRAEAGCEGPDG